MSLQEDKTWRALLVQSAPTFAGETVPPLGLATRVLARVREERTASERIGLRAIFASLAVVAVTTTLTVCLHVVETSEDPDPGVRSMALVEDVQVS